jgi:hypothetical protein
VDAGVIVGVLIILLLILIVKDLCAILRTHPCLLPPMYSSRGSVLDRPSRRLQLRRRRLPEIEPAPHRTGGS